MAEEGFRLCEQRGVGRVLLALRDQPLHALGVERLSQRLQIQGQPRNGLGQLGEGRGTRVEQVGQFSGRLHGTPP